MTHTFTTPQPPLGAPTSPTARASGVGADAVVAWTRAQVRLPAGSRVAVAMSGGVDSSVVAALLAEAGYEVVGLTARLSDVDTPKRAGACCAPDDARDARAIAAQLGFRHFVIDERAAFAEEVVTPFLDAWRSGETPNPCVACNRSLKFDRLVKRARALGAEALATGHYARLDDDAEGRPRLQRGRDADKDQAYFLYPLPAETAGFLRFPLGELGKAEVRAHAARLGLAVASKPESMDICFVGDKRPADWVAERVTVPGGALVSLDGTRLGRHDNLARYTVGQRRGLGLPGGAGVRYVVDKRADGTVVIGSKADLQVAELTLRAYNAVDGRTPSPGDTLGLQVRHRARAVPARVVRAQGADLRLALDAPLHGAAAGQAGVLFDGERVVGGGTIAEVTTHTGAGAQGEVQP